MYFNPYNGDYISTWRYGVNQSLGDWIIWSQVPLHFGTYWGLGVKIVWAVAGLAIPLLAVTGLLMYWNRALRQEVEEAGEKQTGAGCGLAVSHNLVRFCAMFMLGLLEKQPLWQKPILPAAISRRPFTPTRI